MATKEKKPLDKKGWRSTFDLIGEARIYDTTFKINAKSEKSAWIYNSMFMSVFCGDMSGNVSCESMGGYGEGRTNLVYVHGKNEDGTDDYSNRFTIDWNDRSDPKILETIGMGCFMSAGLEKDESGKLFIKRFVHNYDFIQYLSEHLTNGMVVHVRGNLKYSVYRNEIQVRKEVTSIYLVDNATPDKYHAQFTQTILVNKESLGAMDKNTNIAPLDAVVLEYFKTFNDYEVKGNVPIHKNFDVKFDMSTPERAKANEIFKKKYLTPRRGYNEIMYDGVFVEGGATVTLTEDDLDDDVKLLIAMGVKTLEEALQNTATSGARVYKMVLTSPTIQSIDDGNGRIRNGFASFIENKYDDEDLLLDCLIPKSNDDVSDPEEVLGMNPPIEEKSEEDELADIYASLGI